MISCVFQVETLVAAGACCPDSRVGACGSGHRVPIPVPIPRVEAVVEAGVEAGLETGLETLFF